MVFEAAQLMDINSSPVLALFYADASFSGQHMTHHPINSKQCIMLLFTIISNYSYYIHHLNPLFLFVQLQFEPRDIQDTSLRTMANRIQKSMLPECEIYKKSLHEGTFHTFLASFLFLFYFILQPRKRWTASSQFLLDRSNRSYEEICCKKEIQKQIVHSLPGTICWQTTSFFEIKFCNGV